MSCLESIEQQSYQDFLCIVVNDGSTDQTGNIARNFTEGKKQFALLNLQKSEHQPGAKVVRTFYKGLESVNFKGFDVICKFDADVVFPQNYLEELVKVYQTNPNAGMVSGLVSIQDEKGNWVFENISDKNHVRGPIKSYRIDCFLDMKGLRPVLGWDNIDVLLSKMHRYDVITLKNLWVKHLRPTAYKYKNQKAEKLGAYFYNIGLSYPLAIVSSLKSAFKNKSLTEFWITMKSFSKQNHSRILTPEEIHFIRKYRWKQMKKKLF